MYAIEFLKRIQSPYWEDDFPKSNDDFGLNEYNFIKRHRTWVRPWLVGLAGYHLSFGGKWFAGFTRGGARDYVAELYRNVKKVRPKILDVHFIWSDYREIDYLPHSVIYFDPPYSGTYGYRNEPFDTERFWRFVQAMAEEGNAVYVSEIEAPKPFQVVETFVRKQHLSGVFGSSKPVFIERLFYYNPHEVGT